MKKMIVALLLMVPMMLFSQDSTFKIVFPDDWIAFQRADVLKAVKQKYELNKDTKDELLANRKSVQLFGYAAPNRREGVTYRPNIQVLLLKNQTTSFVGFKNGVAMGMASFGSLFQDMRVVDSLTEVTVGGQRAVYIKIRGKLVSKSGFKVNVTSRLYAVPINGYTYQITMNDCEDYDCETEFEEAVQTIEF